jgi:hypothetical protein
MSNWAQRGKEALATVSAVPAGMKKIGGGGGDLEPIQFYAFNTPKNPESKTKVLVKGTAITGTYEGSFVGKQYGNTTHKIRTESGIAGLPGTAQINRDLANVAQGTKVQVVYTGKAKVKTGNNAGKEFHSFDIFGE